MVGLSLLAFHADAKEKLNVTLVLSLATSQRSTIHSEIIGVAPLPHRGSVRGILDRVTAELANIERISGLQPMLASASDSA